VASQKKVPVNTSSRLVFVSRQVTLVIRLPFPAFVHSISTASEAWRTRGHNEAASRPDSERLRADPRKTPLQGRRMPFIEA
jgi:hypothetical protein